MIFLKCLTKTMNKTRNKINEDINFMEVYKKMNFTQGLSLSLLAISFFSFLFIIFAAIDNKKINLS